MYMSCNWGNKMSDNIMLQGIAGSPWIYDPALKEYSLTVDSTVVAIIDQYGNLKIKGRTLKIS